MRSGRSALSTHGHLRSLRIGPSEVANWWSERRTQWFVDDDLVATLQTNRDNESTEIPCILSRADDVLEDRIPLFSLRRTFDYQHPRRWHQDVVLDRIAPAKFHGQSSLSRPGRSGR